MNMHTKTFISALMCAAALALVSVVGSANANENKPGTANAAGKPNIGHIVADIEPFRAAARQGDWKLVWRTLLLSNVELFDVTHDPSEKNNVAVQYPEKVAALQQRLGELAKQSEKPLFLVDQFKVITKNMQGEPILPTDEDFAGAEQR
jgi:hypothetical protein